MAYSCIVKALLFTLFLDFLLLRRAILDGIPKVLYSRKTSAERMVASKKFRMLLCALSSPIEFGMAMRPIHGTTRSPIFQPSSMLVGRSSGKEAGAGSQDKQGTTFDGKFSGKRSTSFDWANGASVISLTINSVRCIGVRLHGGLCVR